MPFFQGKRPPAVAGYFYPAQRELLLEAIRSSFTNRLGPGKLPTAQSSTRESKNSAKLKCLIVPHAGYTYSGSIAAHSYLAAFDSISGSRSDSVTAIILGPNHYGLGSGISLSSAESWETPLGDVRVDADMAERIQDNSEIVDIEGEAHAREHSIEVQVPFLQFISSTARKQLSIVPISMMLQDKETCEMLSKAILASLKSFQDSLNLIIGSSDLTHYEAQEDASRKDAKLLSSIKELNVSALYGSIERMNISACGYGPMAVTTLVAKGLGFQEGRVLKHATSGDVTGDVSSVVGYSAVEFK
ncbi:MAG TPA: AmmeMemoRadiSam system protein B [Nitrososphaerales archaeon]|nr:AmmeMemoRadiSam system protein B [Nitrososphaerales archaeon]